ncbi:MAG TPA: DUF2934 domain-containing protein [Kiritimatiellia bacterium]|nr:DUF2934 domain-containing protein [Kiritimatiellia bacterium]HRZ12592.1 DUF2934 domain-containing protein [Kiritimatiellia bacterium]HSA17670.1 DUF2934 domain-containing protein [Kiritimatiellia bacterium]
MAPAKKKSEKEATPKAPKARKAAAPAAAAPRKRAAAKPALPAVAAEERQKLVELEAYFVAEKDGFRGDSKNYWITAEAIVEARLAGKK